MLQNSSHAVKLFFSIVINVLPSIFEGFARKLNKQRANINANENEYQDHSHLQLITMLINRSLFFRLLHADGCR
ncbi:hypothetical protein ENTCAN_08831 [Enterobacter cancerogenus ATCC 35316]|nr:hypothetical protein ENTCAN_08831 [Enterobacter cancerogenus ATCC 35316]